MPKGIYKRIKLGGMLGKHHTKGAREKMSEAKKGKHYSPKTEFQKGQTPWNKGEKTPEAVREKLSQSHKGNIGYWRNKRRPQFSKKWRENMGKSHEGEKSHLWRGGITPINAKIRNGLNFRLWRESVFARDNWTCQKCGERGGKLCAHHIKSFAEYPDLRFAIDNGITLSDRAHREFHKIYGKKNNTREQLNEFLE